MARGIQIAHAEKDVTRKVFTNASPEDVAKAIAQGGGSNRLARRVAKSKKGPKSK